MLSVFSIGGAEEIHLQRLRPLRVGPCPLWSELLGAFMGRGPLIWTPRR